jgi:dTDP-glucose pyrophosphorylase
MMWGIVPAAGSGTRIQPLAFSKELLPVGSRCDNGFERPRAVSEHLIERMTTAGVDRICFVISPTKSDILRYYGGRFGPAHVVYGVQPEPRGLCDAIFRAAPLVAPDDAVLIGLPDTIWFPEDGFLALPEDRLALLLFPVDRPELFDAVVTASDGRVRAASEAIASRARSQRSGLIRWMAASTRDSSSRASPRVNGSSGSPSSKVSRRASTSSRSCL